MGSPCPIWGFEIGLAISYSFLYIFLNFEIGHVLRLCGKDNSAVTFLSTVFRLFCFKNDAVLLLTPKCTSRRKQACVYFDVTNTF